MISAVSISETNTIELVSLRNTAAARSATAGSSAPTICGSSRNSCSALPSRVRSGHIAMSKLLPLAASCGATTSRVVPTLTVDRRMTSAPSCMLPAMSRAAASIMSTRATPSADNGVPTVMMYVSHEKLSSNAVTAFSFPNRVTPSRASGKPVSVKCGKP